MLAACGFACTTGSYRARLTLCCPGEEPLSWFKAVFGIGIRDADTLPHRQRDRNFGCASLAKRLHVTKGT
jgi:hypothetical protein